MANSVRATYNGLDKDWLTVDVGPMHFHFHHTKADPANRYTLLAVQRLAAIEQLREWRSDVLEVGMIYHAKARREALADWALGRGNYHPDSRISGIEYAWLPDDYKDGLRTNARAISQALDEGMRLWRLAGRRRWAFIRMLQGVPRHGSTY